MKALLIVLLVLFLVGMIPLGASFVMMDAATVRLIIGPFHKQLVPKIEKKPAKKKKEKKPKKPKEKPEKEEKPKEKPKQGFALSDLEYYLPMAKKALAAVGSLLHRIALRRCTLYVTYGGKDAAATGINYGRAWAVLGGLSAPIDAAFRVKKRDFKALYDPEETKMRIQAELKATLFVWQILWVALYYGAQEVKLFFKLRKSKKQKAVQKNESSSD